MIIDVKSSRAMSNVTAATNNQWYERTVVVNSNIIMVML